MSPVPSTQSTTQQLPTVTAPMVSTPTNMESALKNVEPTKSTILQLINAVALKVLAESMDNVQYVLMEPRLLPMEKGVQIVDQTNNSSMDFVPVKMDTL